VRVSSSKPSKEDLAKAKAFVDKFVATSSLKESLEDLVKRVPQGFDTWEDYYRYGDAFVGVRYINSDSSRFKQLPAAEKGPGEIDG